MFTPISVFFKETAFGRALSKIWPIILLVVVAALAVWWGIHTYNKLSDDLATANRQLGAAQVENQQLTDKVSTLNGEIAKLKLANEATNQAQNEVQVEKKKIEDKYRTNGEATKKQVQKIDQSTTLSEAEKHQHRGEVYITQLWKGYCGQVGVDNPQCSKYKTADTATVSQDNPSPGDVIVVTQVDEEQPEYA